MLLVRDVAAAAVATDRISLDEFLAISYVRGKLNGRLEKPGNTEKPPGDRLIRLTDDLDAPVNGDFLTLWCWHPPYRRIVILTEHSSLAEIEELIVGPAGVLNGFVDFLPAFLAGAQADYQVRSTTWELLANGGRRICSLDVARATPKSDRLVVWTLNSRQSACSRS